MKSRGSAIIIAFFLMAAIGGVAFGIGRIFVLDTAISSLYENGTVAYYAAESGIEEGMLRYRFNQNAEVHPDYVTSHDSNRRDLGTKGFNPNSSTDEIVSTSMRSIYDLAIKYKADFYGNDVYPPGHLDGNLDINDIKSASYSKGDAQIFHIPRDEAVKIDISNVNNGTDQDLDLFLKMSNFAWAEGDYNHPDETTAFIEAKVTGKFASDPSIEYKKILASNLNMTLLRITDLGSIVELTPNGTSKVFSRSKLISAIAGAKVANSSKAELTLKPVGCDIDIALVPKPSKEMASPWTTIKSVGYYGDATRTLTANIDRQSGTVYDLFDFVVYKHN